MATTRGHLNGAWLGRSMAMMALIVTIGLPQAVRAGVPQPPPVIDPGPEPSPGTLCNYGFCSGPLTPVAIDIMPGTVPNCFNNDGHGVIPVAILGSATFDVTRINVASVRLQGLLPKLSGNGTPLASVEDVNRDGVPDMVIHFQDVAGTFPSGARWAALTGLNVLSLPFYGFDTVCIVH
jgi:hypothetical protein